MQAKCTQNPTRVPGSPQAVRTRDHTDATPLRTSPRPRSRRGEGVGSRSSAATAIAPTSERAPAVAKPAVHPAAARILNQIAVGDELAFRRTQRQVTVNEPFFMADGYRLSRRRGCRHDNDAAR